MKIIVFDVPATTSGALTVLEEYYTRAIKSADVNVQWIFVVVLQSSRKLRMYALSLGQEKLASQSGVGCSEGICASATRYCYVFYCSKATRSKHVGWETDQ